MFQIYVSRVVIIILCKLNSSSFDLVSWAILALGLDRVIITTFGYANVVIEVTTAVVVGRFGVNFTAAADLAQGVVDLVATILVKENPKLIKMKTLF